VLQVMRSGPKTSTPQLQCAMEVRPLDWHVTNSDGKRHADCQSGCGTEYKVAHIVFAADTAAARTRRGQAEP
jgi:hypothetical protein